MHSEMKRRVKESALARRRLVQQITSCWRTQALHVAVQLGLPDQLAEGQGDVLTLARLCQCEHDGMQRLLRALCALQVCRERRDGCFELTVTGEALRRTPADGSASLRALALWWGGAMWPMWGDLAYSVRTGLSARTRQTGSKSYAYLDQQPVVAAMFHEAMQAMTAMIADDVAKLDTWRDARQLVDIGGGNGTLATALALAHPQLHVTVLDRADAKPEADNPFSALTLAGRANFIVGDFFDSIPVGADHYMLKSILHNWDDLSCHQILAACAAAAASGSRLLLIERIRPERLKPNQHDEALARTDLNMLAGLGGRERTLKEFNAILSQEGFEMMSVAKTQHEFSVIEAKRT